MIETGAAGAAGAAAAAKTAAAGKAAALLTSVGVGVGGGILMILLDPPKTRRQMFLQAVVAGVTSIVFGPAALGWVDSKMDFIDLKNADFQTTLELAAPVYFILGTMSWGVAGAAVKIREWVATKGADKVIEKLDKQ